MARSTYHDQFHNLVDKGYLVRESGNHYVFYEKPHTSPESNNAADAINAVLPQDIEINNTSNNLINNNEETKPKEVNTNALPFTF